MVEILHEQVVENDERGICQRVRRWLSGWHPEEGRLILGWTGEETEVEKTVIKPTVTYIVEE